MSKFFTPHSRDRAEQRYGFRPTIQEMSRCLRACRDGHATIMRTRPDGVTVFRTEMRGRPVYPVVAPTDVIITFLPPDFMLASTSKAHRQDKARTRPKPEEQPKPPALYRKGKRVYDGWTA